MPIRSNAAVRRLFPALAAVLVAVGCGPRQVTTIGTPCKPWEVTLCAETFRATLPFDLQRATGQDVIVGIVDTGVDYTHETLRKKNGRTRILFLRNVDPNGAEWTAQEIDDALRTKERLDYEVTDHGTAVAILAAGSSARFSNCGGIAPESELIIATIRSTDTSLRIAEAVSYVFHKADELGKRAVVCVAGGSLTGSPGFVEYPPIASSDDHIVVAAVGNHGGRGVHARATLTNPGSAVRIPFVIPSGDPASPVSTNHVEIEMYYAASCSVVVSLIDPAGRVCGVARRGDDPTDGQNLFLYNGFRPGLQSVKAIARVAGRGSLEREEEWALELSLEGDATDAEVGAWIVNPHDHVRTRDGTNGSVHFTRCLVDSLVVDWPAALPNVIGVGAYDPGSGEVAGFSSPGWVRSGEPKPDVLAPGVCIATPRPRLVRRNRDEYFAGSGTSFATPLVAGLVALMLEKDPETNLTEIRIAMASLAVHDFQPAPNHRFGYGKLFQR